MLAMGRKWTPRIVMADVALRRWRESEETTDWIGEWHSQGRDVFAYFNNDGYGHAVRNALRLRELVPCPGCIE
jgi:uncharacterized protein YecE (DUF72 family)